MSLNLNLGLLENFINDSDFKNLDLQVKDAHDKLHNNPQGDLRDFGGWLDLPEDYDKDEVVRIKAAAKTIRDCYDVLVVIGIGGSYLGARAVIELVKSKNYNLLQNSPKIFFVGNSISSTELNEIYSICEESNFCVNVISKSGTTTEPAIAFRVLKDLLYNKYGDGADNRIFVTTDKSRGALRSVSNEKGYETFIVPDDVGGRYSVLTAVGLLAIAAAGIDIDALMRGAAQAMHDYEKSDSLYSNDCYKYAAARNLLYKSGKKIELFASYEPDFTLMNEWLKQLFGESEGKNGEGLFPASVVYSTDLHSMGQYVQDGERLMFETSIIFDSPKTEVVIPEIPNDNNLDELKYLAGKKLSKINYSAFAATAIAHYDGGVPGIIISLPEINEFNVGYMIYFFEKACAIACLLIGVNPFDQPGVEEYKINMFAILGKYADRDIDAEIAAETDTVKREKLVSIKKACEALPGQLKKFGLEV